MRNERQDTQGYAARETSGGVPAAGEASVSQPHVPSAYTDDRGIRDYRLLNNVANLYRDTGIHIAGDEEKFLAARENVAQAIKPKTSGTDPRMMALPRYRCMCVGCLSVCLCLCVGCLSVCVSVSVSVW